MPLSTMSLTESSKESLVPVTPIIPYSTPHPSFLHNFMSWLSPASQCFPKLGITVEMSEVCGMSV